MNLTLFASLLLILIIELISFNYDVANPSIVMTTGYLFSSFGLLFSGSAYNLEVSFKLYLIIVTNVIISYIVSMIYIPSWAAVDNSINDE